MEILGKYKLKKDLPYLRKGVIFEHREYDFKHPDRGNPGYGVLILGWVDGMCQDSWCGETFIFPGQLVTNHEWFEPINDENSNKNKILAEIERLKGLVNRL